MVAVAVVDVGMVYLKMHQNRDNLLLAYPSHLHCKQIRAFRAGNLSSANVSVNDRGNATDHVYCVYLYHHVGSPPASPLSCVSYSCDVSYGHVCHDVRENENEILNDYEVFDLNVQNA